MFKHRNRHTKSFGIESFRKYTQKTYVYYSLEYINILDLLYQVSDHNVYEFYILLKFHMSYLCGGVDFRFE